MKKNIIYIALLFFSFTLISCEEDLEIFDSNTSSYSGTYFWQLWDETYTELYSGYDHASQLMIYNTSDNLTNEIWLEDINEDLPLKSKFFLSGMAESFQSSSMDFADLENNLYAIEAPGAKPTGLGESVTVGREYIRNVIIEGKVLKNLATTTSGNPVDSIYIKIKMLSGTVNFTSFSVPIEERADPEVEQFDWLYESAAYDNTLDESYVLAGHRKTGFAEDDH
jgi:hypothetical protein|tara:strand:- start:9820 stop:10491 length:672 start_codon:yes stop_codon:yes gene_type:complete